MAAKKEATAHVALGVHSLGHGEVLHDLRLLVLGAAVALVVAVFVLPAEVSVRVIVVVLL